MHDTAAQLPKIFQGCEHCLKVSGSVDIHVYVHMDNSAALAKLAANLKEKTDEAKAAVDAAPKPVPQQT